jgi:heme/copper-type cytochrome/quinol oxidase subunit 2
MSLWRGDFGRPARVKDPKKQAEMDAKYVKRLEEALEKDGEDPRWSAVQALALAAFIAVFVLAITVGLLWGLAKSKGSGPESALSLVFVAAAVVLILVVCTLSIVFKRLRLEDSREAMGLPKGSVRAVIALMLILLFFIAAIFLFSSTRRDLTGTTRQFVNLSATQYAALDPNEILSSSTKGSGADLTYDVTLLPALSNTDSSDDIAKQLITTVGTLVTAVAAFYFGANSVTTAMGAGRRPTKGSAAPVAGGTPAGGTPAGGPDAGGTAAVGETPAAGETAAVGETPAAGETAAVGETPAAGETAAVGETQMTAADGSDGTAEGSPIQDSG